ncbi:MAG: hypothetical protein LAP21_02470 [Acidobacteriia bacterium]|nr:hypothetical protein [Terriglobia bacterium]
MKRGFCGLVVFCVVTINVVAQAPVGGAVYTWDRYWDSSQSVPVSAATRSLIPSNAVVEADFFADLGRDEEVTVYAVPVDQIESRVFVLFSHHGLLLQRSEIDDFVSGGSPVEFKAAAFFHSGNLRAVFVAASVGFDGAGNSFFAIARRKNRYSVIWRRQAAEGRIVLKSPPAGLTLFGVDWRGECVWCAHHYKSQEFRWNGSTFRAGNRHKIKGLLSPELFSETPIVFEGLEGVKVETQRH